MLHTQVDGHPGRGRIVLVHGFTQTLRSWDPVARALAGEREVVRTDLPGHGGSAGVRLGFAAAAAAVGEAGGTAAYVGYSLGGRLCLRLALDRPDLVSALVLLGASPGLADAAERAARRAADADLAAAIETGGTAAFLDEWLAQPLFADLRPAGDDLAARRANPPTGLADALRLLGTGTQEPLWERLAELTMPVLLVAGQRDAKFSTLARQMADRLVEEAGAASGGGAGTGAVEVAVIEGTGHAAHLERPAAFAAVVEAFLDRHRAS